MNLHRFLPEHLAPLLGYEPALDDPAAVAAAVEDNLAAAQASHDPTQRVALHRLTGPLEFQSGLLGLHREIADRTVYLYSLAGASETNLDLDDPDQRALYRALLRTVDASEQLRARLAEAAALALPAGAAAELQHR
ncbi:hypothetical protein ACFV1L_22020 [Kitasatospora sp. NPDC059646]|uniref:hypothetical protein n=1 Tax=Kitasatospora sp. NPDC059646 TaxID=3346893 RepID=UPI00367CC008